MFVAGTYMFSMNILNELGYFMKADIMHESSALMGVYCYYDELSASTATVFSTCQKDEIVYVRTTDGGLLGMHGDPNDRWSSFSGFLMSIAY